MKSALRVWTSKWLLNRRVLRDYSAREIMTMKILSKLVYSLLKPLQPEMDR
jgi:hypothetical protein